MLDKDDLTPGSALHLAHLFDKTKKNWPERDFTLVTEPLQENNQSSKSPETIQEESTETQASIFNDSSDCSSESSEDDNYNDNEEDVDDANIFSNSTNKIIASDFTCSDDEENAGFY
ncbi:hypothetical protein C2G38_2036454 [Gigaspora rosea]|uniref:Uncharacterized protein n=1 Tax=Gigaspora rosea TaxID=44941 RepID=A0A397VGG7_9GLOM|nr:hypothetical protein C2G38_2036454 [Gigaspora rosea]